MFDLDIINSDLLGGGFHYRASHKHNIGIEINALGFEEKVKMNGIPTSIDFGWDVDLNFVVAGPNMIDVVFGGDIELNMNSDIDELTIFYPKSNPSDEDVTFIEISDIPSIDLEARASLYANRIGLLTVRPGVAVNLDMSSNLGEISIYYPKTDPNSDPDSVFINIPKDSIPSSVELGAETIVNVDLENILNPLPLFSASLPSGLNIRRPKSPSFVSRGPNKIPSDPTPKLRLQIIRTCDSESWSLISLGSMTI